MLINLQAWAPSLLTGLLTGSLAGSTWAAQAAEAPPTAERARAENITVVATRIDDDVKLSPANVTTIGAGQIARSPAATLPELFSLEAGVLSRSLFGNSASRSTVDIRGFGASGTQNTLILLDGRRLNELDLSSINYAAIPLHNVERVEILRGTGAVLYGDGAIGGTINIVTKRPEPGARSAGVSLGYGSYETARGTASLALSGAHTALSLAANVIDGEGYRDNGELEQRNLQLDLSTNVPGSTELFVKGGVSDQALGLPGVRTVDPNIGLDELRRDRRGTGTPNDFAEEDNQFVTAGARWDILAGTGEAVIDAGYRHQNQEAFFDDYVGFPPFFPPGTFADFLDNDLDTWSLTPRIRATSERHEWIAGFDWYHYDYDSKRFLDEASADPNHVLSVIQRSYALYANDRVTLYENTYFEFGVRLQHVSMDSKDRFNPAAPASPFVAPAAAPLSRSDTEPTYSIGFRHFFSDAVSVFARYGRSVRFATVDELYQANPVTFVQEFSIIDPQIAEQFDFGIEYSDAVLSASLAAYHMDLEDEIHFNAQTFANENLDPTERQGIEASLRWQPLAALLISANYAYLRSKFTDGPFDGNDVPVVPRHTGSISVLWDADDWLSLGASWRYVGEKYFDNDQTNDFGQQIPSYDMLDLKLSAEWNDWRLTLAANNLLDEQAFDYGVRSTFTPGRFNAYPLPERNFSLTLAWTYGD